MDNIIEISHLSKSFGPVQDLSFQVCEGERFAFLGVNGAGILLMTLMMVPNIVFALTHREGFVNRWSNRTVELLEQLVRFGCFIFMCVRIQLLCGGYWFPGAHMVVLAVDAALLLAYWLIWVVCWRRDGLFRAAMLSALPSALFLFSGVAARNYPLLAAALVFAPCHICISCKNAPVIR